VDTHSDSAAKLFGAQLRFLREQAGLDPAELGAAVGNSPHTITSWERGVRVPHKTTISQLDKILGGNGTLIAGGKHLRNSRTNLPGFDDFTNEEAGALSLYSYEDTAIPGLLQTEGYARAIISAYCPPLSTDRIDDLVAERLDRQALLTRAEQPVLGFILEEWILRRPIGGRKVQIEQVARVREVAHMRGVTVQLMAMDCEEHSGLDGPMVILETGNGRTLGYTEGQGESRWIHDPDDVRILTQRYGMLRAQALNKTESLKRIDEIAERL